MPLGILFRLDRLGLWPNDPIRERGHIRGRSTKVEMEVALQEELKVFIADLNLSKVNSHLETFVRDGLKHPNPLNILF